MVEKPSLKAHEDTYSGVISLLKWGTAASLIVAALVIWLIAA
jgi:hypothetical protein